MGFKSFRAKRSHDFIATEVNAIGLRSFKHVIIGFLGTGMAHGRFHTFGTVWVLNERLKIIANMLAS